MSDIKAPMYSAFASHVRSELKPEDLSQAADALQRANKSRRRILDLHRSNTYVDEDSRKQIVDLVDDIDMKKLNQLFRSPINVLPPDMKYDEKAAAMAWDHFRKNTPSALNVQNAVKVSPMSAKFDSIEDFDAWRDRHLLTAIPIIDSSHESRAKPLEEKLELVSEIEQCLGALEIFEKKFSNVKNEIPAIPNRLNEEVHRKIEELSTLVNTVDEFTKAKTSIVESSHRIEESVKPIPASKNNRDIQEILCQVETVHFPSACDD